MHQLLKKTKYNRSTYFILPFYDIPFSQLNQYNNVFINTYLFGEEVNYHIYSGFYIVLDYTLLDEDLFSKDKVFNEYFISFRKKDPYLILKYKRFTLVNDIISLLNMGKYSRLPKKCKDKIINYVKPNHPSSLALYPSTESRKALEYTLNTKVSKDAEILSPINLKEETLTL